MKNGERLARSGRICTALACIGLLSGPVLSEVTHGMPKFSFRVGEKLIYQISQHSLAHAGPSAGAGADLEGEAVLTVREVRSDGTFEIDLTASGKGRIMTGKEVTELESEPPARIMLVVSPNGSIIELQDFAGKPTTLFAVMRTVEAFLNASNAVLTMVASTHTLFGVQVPKDLPPPGGKWSGYYKQEYIQSPDLSRVQLKDVAATFTFIGRQEYKGRSCLAFSTNARFMGIPEGLPTTFYFDDAKGQLVGTKLHVAKFGAQRVDVDWSTALKRVE